MMTLEDWKKRDDLQAELKQILTLPAFRGALEALTDFASPKPVPAPQGVDLSLWGALLNARREGFFDALRNFQALTDMAAKPAELPAPWTETKENKE
jgi:hypothetical protein